MQQLMPCCVPCMPACLAAASCTCCRYVGLTRAKNFCVLFDRDGAARAPLYHFLRRLSLGSHVNSVLGGGLAGAVHGSLSNNPLEWSKRAANLVEMKLFKLAAQCYGSAGDVLRAAAYGALDILHVSNRMGLQHYAVRRLLNAPGHPAECFSTWRVPTCQNPIDETPQP